MQDESQTQQEGQGCIERALSQIPNYKAVSVGPVSGSQGPEFKTEKIARHTLWRSGLICIDDCKRTGLQAKGE